MSIKAITGKTRYVTTMDEWLSLSSTYRLSELAACHAEALAINEAGLNFSQIEASKAKCRTLIAELEAYLPGRVFVCLNWIDGAWRDYWWVSVDGEDVGEIYYDSYGPIVKGDKLGTLVYLAGRAAERD